MEGVLMGMWFEYVNKEMENTKASLFVFPFAGGGVSSFRRWGNQFKDINLFVAQYPGRENRFSEKQLAT